MAKSTAGSCITTTGNLSSRFICIHTTRKYNILSQTCDFLRLETDFFYLWAWIFISLRRRKFREIRIACLDFRNINKALWELQRRLSYLNLLFTILKFLLICRTKFEWAGGPWTGVQKYFRFTQYSYRFSRSFLCAASGWITLGTPIQIHIAQ